MAALARSHRDNPQIVRRLATLSGICLATVILARLEGLIYLAALLPLALTLAPRGPEGKLFRQYWLGSMSAFALLGTVIAILFSRSYLFTRLTLSLTPGVSSLLVVVLAVLLVAGWVLVHRPAIWWSRVLDWLRRCYPLFMGALWVLAAGHWHLADRGAGGCQLTSRLADSVSILARLLAGGRRNTASELA